MVHCFSTEHPSCSTAVCPICSLLGADISRRCAGSRLLPHHPPTRLLPNPVLENGSMCAICSFDCNDALRRCRRCANCYCHNHSTTDGVCNTFHHCSVGLPCPQHSQVRCDLGNSVLNNLTLTGNSWCMVGTEEYPISGPTATEQFQPQYTDCHKHGAKT
jgi:hypothetical protein